MATMPSWQSKGIFDPRVEREYKEIKGQDILILKEIALFSQPFWSLVSADSIVVSADGASFLLIVMSFLLVCLDSLPWSRVKSLDLPSILYIPYDENQTHKVIISESEGEEPEDRGRIIQDIDDDPLVSLVRESMKMNEKST
ncbi:hypothetical protein Tco_0757137, partial [Tanacetum coccineum]